MIVSGVLGKIANLTSNVALRPASKVYNPSKSSIGFRNFKFKGIESIVLTARVVSSGSIGVSKDNYSYSESFEAMQIQITFLPTSPTLDVLKTLAVSQTKKRGWINLELVENGELIGKFRSHIISFGDNTISHDGESKTVTFGVLDNETKILTNVLTQTRNMEMNWDEN